MQQPIVRIQNLTKRFGGSFALQGIDLTIHKGEIFGVIGMSGAGKSTLIRCLASLERPSAGEIFLNGIEIAALSDKKMRAERVKIGMIFQHFNLFSSRTALENITYPLEIAGMDKRERLARANELIELVGLKGKKSQYPAQLSGGEKQRIAIARALARKPDVLLCDEATSALDPQTTQAILELLAQLNQTFGLTIVLITHEMGVIKEICTHVAVLEQGEVVEKGKTVDLFSNPKHPTTKRFLQNLTHTIPKHFLPKRGDQELFRLFFKGECAGQPIISRLIREHHVEVNILLGGIDVLQTETVGSLVIALTGPIEERKQACKFLEDNGVIWEKVAE